MTQPAKQPRKPKIDKTVAIALRKDGATYKEIADRFNTDKSCVYRAIKDLLPNDTTAIYKERRADILAKMQHDILMSIQPSDIKSMPVGQRLMGYGILYDKERIERGLSTSNHAIIHADIEALRKQSTSDDYDIIDLD